MAYIVLIDVNARLKEKEVTELRYFEHMETGYCVCPGCKCTFEREYQSYCDRCGQKLAWNRYTQGSITVIKRIPCIFKSTNMIRKHNNASEVVIQYFSQHSNNNTAIEGINHGISQADTVLFLC